MDLLVMVLLVLGQASAPATGLETISAPHQKLLQEVAAQSGLSRTWIPYRQVSPVPARAADATYRTTLAFGPTVKDQQLIDAEVRRFGRVLFGYSLDSTGKPEAAPTWIGYDSVGSKAGILDKFYAAITSGDLVGARAAGASFATNDLDVAVRLAALEKRRGNSRESEQILVSIKDKAAMPAGLSEVAQRRLREDTDFFAADAIRLIVAQRELVAASLK
jgi:hypothetical protein